MGSFDPIRRGVARVIPIWHTSIYLLFNIQKGKYMNRHSPIDMDQPKAFRLPEHMRRDPLPAPSMVPQTPENLSPRHRAPDGEGYLRQLEESIRLDPLRQIAATICSLRYEDMMTLATELADIESNGTGTNAHEYAASLHKWAKAKCVPALET